MNSAAQAVQTIVSIAHFLSLVSSRQLPKLSVCFHYNYSRNILSVLYQTTSSRAVGMCGRWTDTSQYLHQRRLLHLESQSVATSWLECCTAMRNSDKNENPATFFHPYVILYDFLSFVENRRCFWICTSFPFNKNT